MNQAYMDIKTVTTEFVALASSRTQGTFEISAAPGNTGNVTFKGENGVEVAWVPGESHTFHNIDLSTISIKGTAADLVAILKDSIAGHSNNPADSAAIANGDLKIIASKRLTVNTTSQDLQTKYGGELPAGTLAIAIIPETTIAIRMEMGASATATSAKFSEAGEVIPIAVADANALELYAASESYVALRCFGARN